MGLKHGKGRIYIKNFYKLNIELIKEMINYTLQEK